VPNFNLCLACISRAYEANVMIKTDFILDLEIYMDESRILMPDIHSIYNLFTVEENLVNSPLTLDLYHVRPKLVS
jgi:hypothetical protein